MPNHDQTTHLRISWAQLPPPIATPPGRLAHMEKIGIAASLTIATRGASQLEKLRHTDNWLLETTLQVDRLSDQLAEAKAHAQTIEQRRSAGGRGG